MTRLFLVAVLMMVAGCAATQPPPVRPVAPPADPADGAIPVDLTFAYTVGDLKAHQVGDTVTVDVTESVVGQTQATTDLSNSRGISAGVPNLFGALESVAAANPIVDLKNLVSAQSGINDSGSGAMKTTDAITTTVSAVVTEVLPSGDLRIEGSRHIQLNGENDAIHLRGIVRPQDINSDNTVSSTQIADLDVGLVGSGWVRDQQGGGWGTRILSWIWPF
jgi:flagellar L-ring protein FlgH